MKLGRSDALYSIAKNVKVTSLDRAQPCLFLIAEFRAPCGRRKSCEIPVGCSENAVCRVETRKYLVLSKFLMSAFSSPYPSTPWVEAKMGIRG